MTPVPDFLRTEEQIEIPVGIAFAPTGFIAEWAAGIYYSFFTSADFPVGEYGWDKRRQTSAGDYWYYFTDRAKANVAYEETGGEYNPTTVWEWAAKSGTVLNFRGDNIQDAFGDLISRDSSVRTLRSGKYRHELQMMSLPAAVAAMAMAYGYDHPGFPLDELLKPVDEVLWTDDFQRDMIGNSDVGYADSILWKRRATLWKALGEDDARNWQPMGTGTKWDTTSEKLHNCLAILHSPWSSPIWARVYFVPDPRVDAIYQSGEVARRLTRPALATIFASKAEAQAAATEETGVEPTATAKIGAVAGELALPSGYEEFPDDWVAAVVALKEEYEGVMPSPPRLKADGVLDRLMVEPADIKAWWEVV